MKISQILLAAIMAPLAMAASLPPNDIILKPSAPNHLPHDSTALAERGLIDDMKMKDACKSTFKSDKTKYKTACEGVAGEDEKNLCMLRALLGDAPHDCMRAMIKSMDF